MWHILHICLNKFNISLFLSLLQIDSDDVITRDEQIYVLIGAHAKCERSIQAQIAHVKGLCAATATLYSSEISIEQCSVNASSTPTSG